ncbi:hypothetical protein B0H17DRAFT_1140038 [Mycena rosella]|uniref:Uncharacterized protein n=1 Tax=Mycena rosella TaxID=1033263 RepID=A0AAD7G859_MYCRO|nr:hypothetical protein B0H17DRAFT_1140038 [Mycena rosella]
MNQPPVNVLLLQLAADAKVTEYGADSTVSSLSQRGGDGLETSKITREMAIYMGTPPHLSVPHAYKAQNRYFTLFITLFYTSSYLRQPPSDTSCFMIDQIQGISATIIVGTVDIILLLRIWILSERSRRIFGVLLLMIIGKSPASAEFAHWSHFTLTSRDDRNASCPNICVPVQLNDPVLPGYVHFGVFLRDGVFWFLVVVYRPLGLGAADARQGPQSLPIRLSAPEYFSI